MTGDENDRSAGGQRIADMAAVLSVAELRGLVVAAVGGAAQHPEDVVRALVRDIKADGIVISDRTIREEMIARIRLTTSAALRAQAARGSASVPSWVRFVWPLSLGDVPWLDAATDAGALAVPLPLDAPAVFAASTRMVDYVREHLGGVWRRPPEDTRPIGRR